MRRAALIAAGALLLAACGQGGGNEAAANGSGSNAAAAAEPSKDNLGALLARQPRLAGLFKAAGMEAVLSGKEPYTLLAPTDAAIEALPPATLARLQKPEGKAELTALLRAHVLPGTILTADLAKAVEAGKGKATLATMTGAPLTVTREGNSFRLTGSGGSGALITGEEQLASNGVVHAIDKVLPAPTGK